jgi:hypothetical protein
MKDFLSLVEKFMVEAEQIIESAQPEKKDSGVDFDILQSNVSNGLIHSFKADLYIHFEANRQLRPEFKELFERILTEHPGVDSEDFSLKLSQDYSAHHRADKDGAGEKFYTTEHEDSVVKILGVVDYSDNEEVLTDLDVYLSDSEQKALLESLDNYIYEDLFHMISTSLA